MRFIFSLSETMRNSILQILTLSLCVALMSACGCNGDAEPVKPDSTPSSPSDLPPGKEGVLEEDGP